MGDKYIVPNVRSNSIYGILKYYKIGEKTGFWKWIEAQKIVVKFTSPGYSLSKLGYLVGHFSDDKAILEILREMYKKDNEEKGVRA